MMAFLGIGYYTPVSASSEKEVTLKLIETSDVHGCYYPYDFIRRHSVQGSLARVSALVGEMRKTYGNRLILMDNGDILQGQPVAYYYNYIDTTSVHVVADMLNYMHYDVATMGNHDIEAGHAVYDRWVSQCKFPVLGANIMDVKTGKTYLPPYKVIEREGVKVVVLGMITPAVPSWLPEQLWSGLRFEDMETSARKWVKWIQEKEKPDVLIGLFHAGPEGNKLDNVVENGSGDVARRVPGFDVVFMGHDHVRTCQKIINEAGDSVLLVDPANMAKVVADVTVKVVKKDGKVIRKSVEGKLASVDRYAPDEAFLKTFEKQYQATADFVSRKIGRINKTITTKDAYFGPSAFIDLIHQLQLDITGADVSFCAPLSFAAEIKEGDIYVSDMFNLYKYENMLYTMTLTGKEIKDFLEMSYAIWTNQMKSPDDHLMLLNEKDKGFGRFKNPSFNFDSAAGILYTVDVTKPQGEKINIRSMADGTPFRMDKMYKVAVNSYRGNGGGDLLTKGAGIPKQDLAKRIVFATEKDLRYYLMKRIEEVKILDPRPLNQWKFIPEKWVEPAAKRDYRLLFGEDR
ncbi:5'-nucleotidase C-terminal domain-containing protein [Phocaeicola sp. KGMB11183]|uniref:5'-nucleotidase C-terminal domain-containing protein n=1 Tax=Phocaeicola acetigenes TaxID=3016083 RepID=A0ABT4PI15_9BACT|nr:5'-nucleotidase C-terminal domain-containing protein [Phocaeicola sp. KGMB11183]MCZ8372644.1 5'-nucleotidase C-terminal domain-containing protein [Phocaeicola sp. KGMB11183]